MLTLWNIGDDPQGCGYLLSIHAKAVKLSRRDCDPVIQQIKAQGYTVGKAPKAKPLTAEQTDELLRDMGIE